MSEFPSKAADQEPIRKRIMDSRLVQFIFNTEQQPMLEVHVNCYEGSATSVLFSDESTYQAVEAQRDELIDFMSDSV